MTGRRGKRRKEGKEGEKEGEGGGGGGGVGEVVRTGGGAGVGRAQERPTSHPPLIPRGASRGPAQNNGTSVGARRLPFQANNAG